MLRQKHVRIVPGLVENNEPLEVSAVRILSEQTGYSGFVKTVGPPLADSPYSICQFSRIISMRVNDLTVYVISICEDFVTGMGYFIQKLTFLQNKTEN